MERDTRTIETPITKTSVVLKEWLTGREKRQITSVYLSDINISQEDNVDVAPSYKVTGDMLTKSQDAAIQAVVQSVNGSTEKILDAILDLRDEEYQFVITEINKVTSDPSDTDKKK